MPIEPGARLGAYEIVALVGAGGMGEVYRARDTRLDRIVAIKVLPAQFAADAQLRARFDREARAISSLSHPHICALFDVGHQDGVDFLILEYLEGQTLAERLARGENGLPLHDALAIAIQMCDALDKAHRSGIVHRDLKPANVFLVRSGGASAPPNAKLLDFGLAKSASPVVATSGLSMLPTTPPNLTAQGTILGTFQYMAPEQIEGVEADARTDIFAFGALLFEMLTGRTAFEGKTRASLLGAILKDEPPRVSTVQALAPASLDRIVATCLAKDPDDRWQNARDLLRELKWVASGAASGLAEAGRHDAAGHDGTWRPPSGHNAAGRDGTWRPPSGGRSRVAWAVAGVLGIALMAAGVVVVRHVREAPPAAEAIEFTIPPPENAQFGGLSGGGTGTATQLAVSPDGRSVVFVAGGQSGYRLWLRPIGGVVSRPIPGTEGGRFPFWSPDSRFVGFFAAGKLKKVAITGGPPIVLCDGSGFGATWNRDNVIVFTAGTGDVLQRVSGAGGVPVAASAFDKAIGETSHRWPHFLPDGRHFLFTASTGTCCPPNKPAVIRVGALDSMEAATLFEVESSVAYASGHLLFSRDGVLMAERFDPDTRQVKGDPFPVAEQVSGEGSRYASFSASENGILVYARGAARAATTLTWFDREGHAIGNIGEPATYLNFALSPDERKVAVSVSAGTPPNRDIWIVDSARGTMSRLTFDPGDDFSPIWAPDGSRVAFTGMSRQPPRTLRQKLVSGTAEDEPLVDGTYFIRPTDWSADGRFLAYTRPGETTTNDVWVLPMSGDRKPFAFAQNRFSETNAVFAPNGRWIAYESNEAGQPEVYVQPFPPTGGKYQVSKNSGTRPTWRADGKELFFGTLDGIMMAAAIDTTRQFESGIPHRLFTSVNPPFDGRQYAVSRDGQRFLVNTMQQLPSTTPLTVVVNWPSAVK